MFIKKITKRNKKTSELYLTYRLVRSYKINGQSRHETIIDMATLPNIDSSKHKQLADRIEELLYNTQSINMLEINSEVEYYAQLYLQEILKVRTNKTILPAPKQDLETVPKDDNDDYVPDIQEVDINSFDTTDVREMGGEWLCMQAFEELGIPALLREQLKFNDKEYQQASAYLIGRLLYPGSDLKTSLYLNENSGIQHLFLDNERFAHLDRKSLVKISQKLYSNKEVVEKQLNRNIQNVLQYEPKLILYDLTNSHFEGRMPNSQKATFGRNKQKRNDCRQVTLALAVDQYGFTQYSQIYEGNISEGSTLLSLIENISENTHWTGKVKPVIVMDAGISKEENLIELHKHGYDYICVSRGEHQKLRQQVTPDKLSKITTASGNEIEIQSFDNQIIYTTEKKNGELSGGKIKKEKHIIEERLLYVKTPLKKAKEDGMLEGKRKRIESELTSLQESLGKPKTDKKTDTINQRIGRIKERYKTVQNLYQISMQTNEGLVENLDWTYTENNKKQTDSGTYFIRSTIKEKEDATLWKLYRTIGEVEDIFRTLKSDLQIRGIYHQIDDTIEPHIFGCLIAVNVVNFIRYKLKMNDIHYSWSEIVRIMSTQKVLQCSVKKKNAELLVLKKCSRPTAKVNEIYKALKYKNIPFYFKKYTIIPK